MLTALHKMLLWKASKMLALHKNISQPLPGDQKPGFLPKFLLFVTSCGKKPGFSPLLWTPQLRNQLNREFFPRIFAATFNRDSLGVE